MLCVKWQKIETKKICKYCLQWFSSEKILQEHQKVYLKINCKQSVKLRSGSIKFKNHIKQLSVPFKIYAAFESVLKGLKNNDRNNASYTKKSCNFANKVDLYLW